MTEGKRAAVRSGDPSAGLIHNQKSGGVVPRLEKELHIAVQAAAGHPAQIQTGAARPPDVLADIVQITHLAKRLVRQLPTAWDCPGTEQAVLQP